MQIANKSTPRDIAKNYIRHEVFRRKQKLKDLMGEGGGSSCWWFGITYGSCGGPGRGLIEGRIARGTKYEYKLETFSISKLYREIIDEKQNPRLFK